LAFGADPNCQTLNEKYTPLHLAFKHLEEHKEPKCIFKLLSYGASLDILDDLGNPPDFYIDAIEDDDLRDEAY
jgi:hypothetical protein